MPYGDRTGPRGEGPMTGRGAGNCTGFNRPVYNNPPSARRWFNFGWLGWGRRSGRGPGRGQGLRRYAGYRSRW